MFPEFVRSNRTIVGLKQLKTTLAAADLTPQQSHHCGIETLPFGVNRIPLAWAAIAPLWD